MAADHTKGFRLSVAFNDASLVSITLSSDDIDEEESRCHESLEAISKSLSKIDRERKQLKQVNQQLAADVAAKELQRLQAEESVRLLQERLGALRAQVNRCQGECLQLDQVAKESHKRRYETERQLRQRQLDICRKKLEFTMSTKPENFNFQEYSTYMSEEIAIRDEEQLICDLQEQLVALRETSERDVKVFEEAQECCNRLLKDVGQLEAELSEHENQINNYRSQLKICNDVIDSNVENMADLDDRKRTEKRNHVEIIQTLILVDTCRRLGQVKELE